jgi:hypothetical protein
MARTQNLNADLTGSNVDIHALVEKIAAFDHDNATPDDQVALSRALALVAADVVRRHAVIVAREMALNKRAHALSVTEHLTDVVACLKNDRPARRRGWLNLGR